MAQITINIPDDQAQRVLDAFAVKYGWTPTLTSPTGTVQNPETKAQHAKRRVVEFIRSVVFDNEHANAQSAATSQVTDSVSRINLS
ncbi:MAG TPA: hypothetical protein VEF04_17360 [Blastocatellia bacterium]|nr:hypothetical protein [Blastocatellia bacterium]